VLNKISKTAYFLIIILLVYLPWHAFLKTGVLNSNFFYLAYFKEIIYILLGGVSVFFLIYKKNFKPKIFDYFFFAWLLYIILMSLFYWEKLPLTQYIWGVKYDFSAIFLFYFVRFVDFSDEKIKRITKYFLYSSFFALIFSLLLYFFIPLEFLYNWGYSSDIATFSSNQALSVYQVLPNSWARLAGTLSGPNQMGLFSVLVLLISCFSKFKFRKTLIFLSCFVLILTFSKTAFISLGIIGIIIYFFNKKHSLSKKIFLVFALMFIFLELFIFFPQIKNLIIRPDSIKEHSYYKISGLKQMQKYPLGKGVGTSGPATFRYEPFFHTYIKKNDLKKVLDTNKISDTTRDHIWFYNEKQDLIRFKPLNKKELKNIPSFKKLSKPLRDYILDLFLKNREEPIPESWHLQIFIEYGLLGGVFYLFFLASIIYSYPKKLPVIVFISIILVSGLFLHSLESAVFSYLLFIFLALSLKQKNCFYSYS
jgi:hypothetical protein